MVRPFGARKFGNAIASSKQQAIASIRASMAVKPLPPPVPTPKPAAAPAPAPASASTAAPAASGK